MDIESIGENGREQQRDTPSVYAVITFAVTLFALVVYADWRDSTQCSRFNAGALQHCAESHSPSAMNPPAKGAIAPLAPETH